MSAFASAEWAAIDPIGNSDYTYVQVLLDLYRVDDPASGPPLPSWHATASAKPGRRPNQRPPGRGRPTLPRAGNRRDTPSLLHPAHHP